MKPTTKRMVAMLALLAVTGAPGVAGAGGAKLYELTENMKLVPRHDRSSPRAKRAPTSERRVATAAIAGFAKPGTPLCPADPDEPDCMVHVHGSDNISLTTGLGTLQGQFSTVIQGDNPVDGPEMVVLKGEFRGQMDFSPAIVGKPTPTLFDILLPHPYGTVEGTVKAQRGRNADFTGVFRLPFDGNEIVPGTGLTLRQIFCPATPDANPYAMFYRDDIELVYLDLVYLDNVEAAGTPEGRCLNIQPNELSLGAPLVRFNVKF
jgi:hypothetical protein